MNIISYGDINKLLDDLLAAIQSVIPNELVGLYLYGSLVSRDFDYDISDIDLLAVINQDLRKREFSALKKMHSTIASQYPKWKNRIEVAYLSAAGLREFKNKRSKIAVISPGEPLHIKEAGNDWLINWYTVQENGVALFGSNQNAFIPKISNDEYIHAIKESASYWRERIRSYDDHSAPGSLAYAVFTMCRAMYGYKKGKQVSKKEAALWVATEFPKWTTLIKDSTAWREAQWNEKQENVSSALPQVSEFVNFVIDQILR